MQGNFVTVLLTIQEFWAMTDAQALNLDDENHTVTSASTILATAAIHISAIPHLHTLSLQVLH